MGKDNKQLKIAVGTDNFKKMVTKYDIFVDKTYFIQKIINSSEEAILITFPRRWGKTLNIDMLKTFFEPEEEKYCNWGYYFLGRDCNYDIFKNLKIASLKDKEGNNILNSYQGKYPVIFISLKDVVGDTIEEVTDKLKGVIKSLYKEYRYLESSSKLTANEKKDFQKYIDQDYTGIIIEESVKFLGILLHKHHGERVYVLVDEYDKPVNFLLEKYLGQGKAPEKESLIQGVTQLISYTVCSSVGKTNPALEKLILTGIFDTTQKEFGSGCNNISVYGISDIRFSESFGFSKIETDALISKLGFKNAEEVSNNIKSWYNGYYAPISTEENLALYTPWAVMKFLNTAYYDHDYTPRSYWSKSGASTILQALLTKEKCSNTNIGDRFLDISVNGVYELRFDNQISLFKYDWFMGADNEEFFSYLLLNSGYLTVQRSGNIYQFSIPNAELLEEFSSIIPKANKRCEAISHNLHKTNYLKVIKKIKQKDSEGVKEELSKIHIKCEDHSMNFNFFHLAAIFGDKVIFRALLESECDEQLGFADDRVGGLKAIDYAFMLGNGDVIEVISKHYEDEDLAEIPGWFNSILCYSYYNVFASGGISGSFDFFKDVLLDNLGVKIFAKLGINIAASIANMFGSSKVEEQCMQYAEYSDIDISTPSQFNSLKQFEKYLLHNEKAQVVVNSGCWSTQKELTTLSFNIFENPFYSAEEISFTLCGELTKDEL